MTIQSSAPGKLLLLGEYAVLEGAPALVTAVNRRAKVALQDISGRGWTLTSPQLNIQNLQLEENGRVPQETPSHVLSALKLYSAVIHTFEAYLRRLPAQAVEIDTADFFQADQKIGLGSSAAVAVALAGALAARLEQNLDDAALFHLAATAHRIAQGGVGSNADIAASVHGGTLVHRVNAAPQQISLPTDLEIHTVFTGRAASTPALVGSVFDLRDTDPAAFKHHMQHMTALAHAGQKACESGDAAAFMRIANSYHGAMHALGLAAGADIVSRVHHELHRHASAAGLAYKPSGAGGGDIGLILHMQAGLERLNTLAEAAEGQLLELEYNAPGLKVM